MMICSIFPVFHFPGVTTRLFYYSLGTTCLNWPQPHSFMTLRSCDGQILHRIRAELEQTGSHSIELVDLLKELNLDEEIEFLGSVELELLAHHELLPSLSAVAIHYYGPSFCSGINALEQVAKVSGLSPDQAEERCFIIEADGDCEPYFTLINGQEAVQSCGITLRVINHKKERLEHHWELSGMTPYQVVLIHPTQSVNLRSFLEGRPGLAAASCNPKSLTPSLLTGHYRHSIQAISISVGAL